MEPVLKFDLRLSSNYSPKKLSADDRRRGLHPQSRPNPRRPPPCQLRFGGSRAQQVPMVPTSRIWDYDAFPPYFCNCSDLGELLVRCVPEFVRRRYQCVFWIWVTHSPSTNPSPLMHPLPSHTRLRKSCSTPKTWCPTSAATSGLWLSLSTIWSAQATCSQCSVARTAIFSTK
ncbi:hypothetical protein B0H14DRAFT_1625115 [Mycena olivaceomarginata]|nr:hypothetical protein B0H14DRAFT_1625115 [Mycena olivaceomarginata]